MTKKSQQTFQIICAALTENPTFRTASLAAGISESTLYAWLAAAQRQEPGYTLDEFHGDRDVPLDQACKLCLRLAAAKVVQQLSSRALLGDWTDSLYKGARVYELSPQYLDWSDEDFKNLGIDVALRYQRDERGLPIPVRVWSPPPVALALAVAAANFPRMWGAKSETTLTVRGNLGVTTVGAKPSSPPQVTVVKAAAIAPPPIDQGDDDLSDLLDGSNGAPENIEVASEPEQAPAAPAPTTATRYGNLTNEQIAIANRMARGMKVI